MPATPEPAEPSAEKDAPLPSEDTAPVALPAPRRPFKFSTFLLTFLFILGLGMIVDQQLRYQVALGIGFLLAPVIGFEGDYPLLTMFCAAVIEMFISALAYNFTTDWVKTAKTQKWSAAFRKVHLDAVRSGKKDRVDALKPHQATVTKLAGELQISQLKGLAVTWFLLIAVYTWVYLFLAGQATPQPDSTIVSLGGLTVNLLGSILGPIQVWFVVFSLYSLPFSLVFRRILKHYTLLRHPAFRRAPTADLGTAGGTA